MHIDLAITYPEANKVVTLVLVSGVHRLVNNTLSFAKGLGTDPIAVYVGFDEESINKMQQKWKEWGTPCRLVVLRSTYRSLLEPLIRLIKTIEAKQENGGYIHIVIPQFTPKKRWHNLLHNQSALLLRMWLIQHKDIVITTVPYHLKD